MNEYPQIGELIRAELHRQGRSNAWLAKQLSCHPRTIGKIFLKSVIDTHQLFVISKALQYDFFKHYSELL
ncbi:MAG: XRE family transcriptional regulator [Bacteroidales bacterium]|nr:XRE family transcriptional regulator [Salinivirgaceae bacterium]MBR4440707.1 XRE family transcriptional regulator [Bacteroidales bacterium]